MSALHDALSRVQGKRMTVGFDGFVDTIARPVCRTATADTPATYFDTIAAFGQYLVEHGGKSCSVELAVERRQLGGNLPNLSRAAGTLGLDVTCIGMLGTPAVDAAFEDMPCRLCSFAPAGQATALEFQDGKVFLAAAPTLSGDPWQQVCAQVPQAAAQFAEADLIALVNWSELPFAQALWQAVFTQAVQPYRADFGRYAFFDLCDCTRHSAQELQAVLTLLGQFAGKRTVVLSLNENEALDCGGKLLGGAAELREIAAGLREKYGLQQVLIHTVHQTLLQTERGLTCQPTQFVEQPKISTGAGDHFNGASCFALLAGFEDAERVRFANAFAAQYVGTGHTPDLEHTLQAMGV